MDDTSTGHEKLQITGLFTTWWKRWYGIPAWYKDEKCVCHKTILRRHRNGQIILRVTNRVGEKEWYEVNYDGTYTFNPRGAFSSNPILCWWPE